MNITQSSTLNQYSFGAALIFELRQDVKGLYYVQIMAKNNSMNQPIALKTLRMDRCEDQLCSLGNFFDITSNKYAMDYDSECSLEKSIISNSTLPQPMAQNCSSVYNSKEYYGMNNLSKLEIALILISGILSLFIFCLIMLLCMNFHRNRVRKTVF